MVKRQKVQVVIFREREKEKNGYDVLLLKTNEKRGSFWQNVTGGVEKSDTDLIKAAIREVVEETSLLNPKINNLNHQYSFIDQWNTEVTEFLFFAKINYKDSLDVKISTKEHQDYKWIDIKSVKINDYRFKTNFDAFKAALNFLDEKNLVGH